MINKLHTSSSAEWDFTTPSTIINTPLYSIQVYAPDLQFEVCVVQSGPVLVHPAVASGHDTLFVPWHHSPPSNQPVKSFKSYNYN
jgi:hypothetical protein